MKDPRKTLAALAACLLLATTLIAHSDDDDTQVNANSNPQSMTPALTAEQQHAVGIVVAHPMPAKVPARERAIGRVLDSSRLLADSGELQASRAAELAASAELSRTSKLYRNQANASLKMLETARVNAARARSDVRTESAQFRLRWGPIAAMKPDARKRLIDACSRGDAVLLRADLPGRNSIGKLPTGAIVEVDGIEVPGSVLGVVRQASGVQSVGMLIELRHAPDGLAPGARLPVFLLQAEHSGLLVPRDAMIYDETGTYVYTQLARTAGSTKTEYAPVKVTLLRRYGDGWLVKGLHKDDKVVVHGAGVLWSLQAIGSQTEEDED